MEPLREIMDEISNDETETVVVRKAAQVGWTEVINNAVGYWIDQEPSTILLIYPTVDGAETYSKDRLSPMLRDTPCLRGKVKEAKSRDSENTILNKRFPGGQLAMVGANTPNNLASRPRRCVVGDEVDKWPLTAGKFGRPDKLAESRQRTYWNRKRLYGSTPGWLKSSVINMMFLGGDQRHYYVPCPYCSHPQVLRWEQIQWDKLKDGTHLPETAYYLCENTDCGAHWTDADRWAAIRTAKEYGGGWIAHAPFKKVASFFLPAWYSSWMTLEEFAQGFLDARHDINLLVTWTNEVKGEAFEEKGEAADAERLATGVEVYDGDSLPDRIRVITAGVDTQDDRIEISIIAWAEGEEAWVITHDIILGDPATADPWQELDAMLRDREFWTVGEDERPRRRLKIRATCIDSGGHHGAQVISFAKTRAGRRIYAIAGRGNDATSSKPIWSKALLNSKNAGDRVWIVGVDTAKDDLFGRLQIEHDKGNDPIPRAIHFPSTGLPATYFEQLTAEHAVSKKDERGRKVRRWEMKSGQERNEALDCFNYGQAAMLSLNLNLMGRVTRGPRPEPEIEDAEVIEVTPPEKVRPAVALAAPPLPDAKAEVAPKSVGRTRRRWAGYGGPR